MQINKNHAAFLKNSAKNWAKTISKFSHNLKSGTSLRGHGRKKKTSISVYDIHSQRIFFPGHRKKITNKTKTRHMERRMSPQKSGVFSLTKP
jgi:hypothetical protein